MLLKVEAAKTGLFSCSISVIMHYACNHMSKQSSEIRIYLNVDRYVRTSDVYLLAYCVLNFIFIRMIHISGSFTYASIA